jgi:hypothetical protein
MSFSELPIYLKGAYVFAWLCTVLQVLFLSAAVYWQMFEPTNLSFKAWLKGPMHLGTFDSVGLALGVFVVLTLVQLVVLFLYTSWINEGDKKAYYVVAGLLLLGIWTYMLFPAILLLGLMLPAVSVQHFGMVSIEDLF